MSLNRKKELSAIARELSRQLRNNPTEAEINLWKHIRNKSLNKRFLRQHPFFYDITGKESFFIADFYCKESHFVIELDGEYHKYRLKEDSFRTEILHYLGLKVIRFSNEEIFDSIDTVMKTIIAELK